MRCKDKYKCNINTCLSALTDSCTCKRVSFCCLFTALPFTHSPHGSISQHLQLHEEQTLCVPFRINICYDLMTRAPPEENRLLSKVPTPHHGNPGAVSLPLNWLIQAKFGDLVNHAGTLQRVSANLVQSLGLAMTLQRLATPSKRLRPVPRAPAASSFTVLPHPLPKVQRAEGTTEALLQLLNKTMRFASGNGPISSLNKTLDAASSMDHRTPRLSSRLDGN